MLPRLPGQGSVPRIYDTATRQLGEAHPIAVAGLYVCGITPYDATHIGHAATYLAYDTLIRVWLDRRLSSPVRHPDVRITEVAPPAWPAG